MRRTRGWAAGGWGWTQDPPRRARPAGWWASAPSWSRSSSLQGSQRPVRRRRAWNADTECLPRGRAGVRAPGTWTGEMRRPLLAAAADQSRTPSVPSIGPQPNPRARLLLEPYRGICHGMCHRSGCTQTEGHHLVTWHRGTPAARKLVAVVPDIQNNGPRGDLSCTDGQQQGPTLQAGVRWGSRSLEPKRA